ncbi:MAG: hypothetical protein AAF329_10510 [Cyanobacteria bacterium P01_A01_bin.17]
MTTPDISAFASAQIHPDIGLAHNLVAHTGAEKFTLKAIRYFNACLFDA